jgi:hypothetical protein
MIENMRKHLKRGGLVIGSTNDRESIVNGVEHHLTRKSISWWIELFAALPERFGLGAEGYR